MLKNKLSKKEIIGGWLGRILLSFWFLVGGFRAVWKRINKSLLEKFSNEGEKSVAVILATEVTFYQAIYSILKDFYNMEHEEILEITDKVIDYFYQLLEQKGNKIIKKDRNIEYYV